MGIDLSNLKEEIRSQQVYELALTIVKYQKFKTNIILQHIKFNASSSTLKSYIGLVLLYLREKRRKRSLPCSIYDAIDKVLAKHVQPLTPSLEDSRRPYKRDYTKKNNIPPVAKLDIVNKPLTETFEYGIQKPKGDIKVCPNKDYALGFMDALEEVKKKSGYKIVAINISEI